MKSEACVHWVEFGVKGALPDCCFNKLPEAVVPYVKLDTKGWDDFNRRYGYLERYGNCAREKQCIPADPRGCLQDVCVFPEDESHTSGKVTPDDGHPRVPIGHRQTCWCYKPNVFVDTGDHREGYPCTKMT